MAYDERLAERMRGILAGAPGVDEKKVFGGIVRDDLMVRVGAERYENARGSVQDAAARAS